MSLSGIHIGLVGLLPPPSGGMANQALQLSECLSEQGAKITFIRTNVPYKPEWISSLKGIRALFRLIPYLYRLWRMAGKVDLVHVLANSGWSWHLFAAPAVWISWLRKTPVIVNYRGGEAEDFFERSWNIVKPTLNKTKLVMVPSGFLEAIFAKRNIGTKVIPNILNLERFTHTSNQEKETSPESTRLVVTRNLEAIYDVGTAIRAFGIIKEKIPNALLTVAGSGLEEASLKALTIKLTLEESVTFTGRLSNTEIADLYQTADMMLNTSLEDNSPNSLIEALASGVPVISSDVGGIPFLIETGITGMLVPPKSPELLAQAALQVLGNNSLKQSVVEQGKIVAQRFEKNKVLHMLECEYKSILGLS